MTEAVDWSPGQAEPRRLPPGPPKFRRRPDQRPREIAIAARAVFREAGYHEARVADIAARAGLSRGGLTRYYPTKGALWRAATLCAGPSDVGDHQPRRLS